MKRILSMFAIVFVWLYTPAAAQIPLPADGYLTASADHISDAPDPFSEANLLGGDLTWQLLVSLPRPRYALAAATALDGSIFAIGGADGGSTLDVVEVYRPGSNQWDAAPSLPGPRYRLAAATGGDGRVYAIGGSDPGGEGALLSSVLALTPGADRWVAVAPMAGGRQLLAATAGTDGRIYAVGGHNLGALNRLEIYDPARDQWTPGAPMPTPRYDMGVALGGDGRIYAIGGSGDGVLNVLDVVEAYSPATNSWAMVAPLPSRRALVDATTGPDGRIYAIGGCELVIDASGNLDCIDSKRVDVYSPQTNVWQTVSPTIVAHREGAATTDGKSIFAIGGHTAVVEIATLVLPPFAAFTAKLAIALAPRIDDAFDLKSRVTLGTPRDGIDPLKEDVTLEFTGGTGSFTMTIPAGSFTKNKKGRFTFKGTVDGVKLDATLAALGNQRYAFTAAGKHADLSGIANPVTVTLTIGDDSGSTTVTAHFKHSHDERS